MKIHNLTLKQFVNLNGNKRKLTGQLYELACPVTFRIGIRYYSVPTFEEFKQNICWGQRMMFDETHESDLESIMFFIANYYQPIVTGKKFTQENVMNFYRKLRHSLCIDIFPILRKFIGYYADMVEMERSKLDKPPTKEMKAAEVHRLDRFNSLALFKVISEELRVPIHEVSEKPYNLIFSLLWYMKENNEYQERLIELRRISCEAHSKR